jgi:hypothetical protein
MSSTRRMYVDVMKEWLILAGQKEAAESMTDEAGEIDERVKGLLEEAILSCNCCTFSTKDMKEMYYHKVKTQHDYRMLD